MNNRFRSALAKQKKATEQHNPLLAGTLGITIQGQQVVEVPDRASYVYVQVRSSQAEVIQAFNARVSPVYGLPVLIQWQGNRYIIFDRDSMRYSNWIDSSAYLPRHASTHEFEGSAGDVVFVSQQQFLPLMPMPSGSNGNRQMVVGHYNLMTATGTFQFFSTQPTVDLTVWNPSSSTGAQMVLVQLDATNGNLVYSVGSGSMFGNWLTGTADVLPNVPAVTDISRYIPIAAVRLVQGTSVISWDNIYDVRPLFGATRSVSAGGGGGGFSSSSGLAVLNNGVLENYANQLNLLGSAFTLTHSGTQAQLTIVGGGGGSSTGALLLDTSNGPLYGPLVVYQKNPNTANQFGDYSSIVGYLSGTNGSHFGAAGEFVNFSTGFNSYTIYVDDEGGAAPTFYLIDKGKFDKDVVQWEFNTDGNRRGTQFSPSVLWERQGNNIVQQVGSMFVLNDVDRNHIGASRQLEIQIRNSAYCYFAPGASGSLFNYPFPNLGVYFYDTWNQIPTGMAISIWNSQNLVMEYSMPDGMHFFEGIGSFEHTGTNLYTNGQMTGKARLTNGAVTIANKRITNSSRVYLTVQNGSGTVMGFPYMYTRMAGSGFTVQSTNFSDNYEVAYLIIEPTIGW